MEVSPYAARFLGGEQRSGEVVLDTLLRAYSILDRIPLTAPNNPINLRLPIHSPGFSDEDSHAGASSQKSEEG